jgi:hypothetical protein
MCRARLEREPGPDDGQQSPTPPMSWRIRFEDAAAIFPVSATGSHYPDDTKGCSVIDSVFDRRYM